MEGLCAGGCGWCVEGGDGSWVELAQDSDGEA